MKSTLRNMILVLLTITLVASAAVGLVYRVTSTPIAQAKVARVSAAIAQVLPEFDNDPTVDKESIAVDGHNITLYTAKRNSVVVGYAVESFSGGGFGGMIWLMVGFLPDKTIYKVETISQSETPGLGDKIMSSKSNFSVQFEGENPQNFKLSVRKDGGNVDAITASTISSRAYCDAVNRAYQVVLALIEGGDPDSISGSSMQ